MCGRVPLALLAGTWISCYLAGPCVSREVGACWHTWGERRQPTNHIVPQLPVHPVLMSEPAAAVSPGWARGLAWLSPLPVAAVLHHSWVSTLS